MTDRRIDGYALHIDRRAMLVTISGARAYDMVFALTHEEFEKLYTAPGLENFRPEAILAHSLEGETLPALCYNPRKTPRPGDADAEYAARLRAVLSRLNFPPEYVASVA